MNKENILNYNNFEISVVIPIINYNFEILKRIFKQLDNQILLPKEIILINNYRDNLIKDYLKKIKCKIPIKYQQIPSPKPGKSRNIGVHYCNYNYIGILDCKTVPSKFWLYNSVNLIINNKKDIVFGKTKYLAKSNFQRLINSFSFGNILHETTPGTLIKKSIFYKTGGFYENVIGGEDLEWRESIKKSDIGYCISNKVSCYYNQIVKSFYEVLKKNLIYSINSAFLNIQSNQKNLYLSIFLIFASVAIPRWNFLIGNWDQNPLFIPNVTKIYVILLLFFSIIYFLYSNINKVSSLKFFNTILKTIIIIFSIYCLYSYNRLIPKWYEESITYIPHITKIYVLLILFILFVFRGLILPYKRKVSLNYLFPFNWIKIGILGMLIDLVRFPGYLFGAFLMPLFNIKNFINKKEKKNLDYKKQILFVCPYPQGVQAGQRLKYEQYFKFFENAGYKIVVESFINEKTWKILYKKGFFFHKLFSLVKGYLKRLKLIFSLKNYDIVYVFMWVTPYSGDFFEKVYRFYSNNIIYDIEDNILIIKKNIINPFTYKFKNIIKINYLISNSDFVISSAPNLNQKCEKISMKKNCFYIPPGVNIQRYKPKDNYISNKIPTIGWTGTFSSLEFLDIIKDVLIKLNKIRKFKFIVISDFRYDIKEIDIENIQWNKKNEIDDLSRIDIGVYPLKDDNWISGKSGLKALQYMALGIPSVSSNLGNVKKIILNKHNGFLVNDNQDWLNTLVELIDKPNLRKTIGIRGRKTIEQLYSTNIISKKYLDIFSSI